MMKQFYEFLPNAKSMKRFVRDVGRFTIGSCQRALDVGHELFGDSSYSDLLFKSRNDGLTNILNRDGLTDAIETYSNITGDTNFLGVFIDVKGLSEVNNNYSHKLGDHLLSVTGWELRKKFAIPGSQLLAARIGGDEFVALLPSRLSTNEQMPISYTVEDGVDTASINLIDRISDKRVPNDIQSAIMDLLKSGITEIDYRFNVGEFIFDPENSPDASLGLFLERHGSKYARKRIVE